MVGGNLLMFASSYSTQKKFPITLLSLLLTFGLFQNGGFRFRILFLIFSLIFFLLFREEKVKANSFLRIGSFSTILITLLMTYIGQIREYGRGFQSLRHFERGN